MSVLCEPRLTKRTETKRFTFFQITFWTIAFIVSNPEVYKIAMDQISTALGDQGKNKSLKTKGFLCFLNIRQKA